ncbi:unnamed protein product [Strongylus vulgaris]|uniref:Uncharacterized protein n=1 Tax=Strongylus vulgaris TaxID=40348 RepID=A0A3P7JXU4_STRVU|nr:unnamed protein product [Strongylus vulgaris]
MEYETNGGDHAAPAAQEAAPPAHPDKQHHDAYANGGYGG